MIIAGQHSHSKLVNSEPKRKRKVAFNAQKETKMEMENLLTKSAKSINNDAQAQLQTMRKNRQDKVYSKLEYSTSDFLIILLKERQQKIQNDATMLHEILHKRQKQVMKDLKSKELEINRSIKSIQTIKNELEQDIEIMKMKNPEKHIAPEYYEEIKKKQQQKYQNYLQFRRHSYWKIPNERHQSALQLISSLQIQQKKTRQRYEKALQMSLKNKIDQQQHKKSEKQQRHKKQRQKLHEQYNQYRQDRQKQLRQQAEKQKQAQKYLEKFKTKAPAFIVFEQNQKKMEELEQRRMRHILNEIKQHKKGYSFKEINESLKCYQQQKQRHAQQLQQKRLLELQSQHQIKSRLRRLYRSKIRSSTAVQQMKSPSKKQQSHEKAMKMLMYSQRVKQKYLPKIDNDKREQLLQSIEENLKKQNKIQKISNGQLILLDKNDLNPRQIGLQYLQELKKMTSLIERKPPTPPPTQEFKLVDRSQIKKLPHSKRITISNWKNIIDDDKLSQSQKQHKLEDYFKLIEEKRIKSIQEKKNVSLSKSIQLQQDIDHYEMEKAAAKLAFLKSLI